MIPPPSLNDNAYRIRPKACCGPSCSKFSKWPGNLSIIFHPSCTSLKSRRHGRPMIAKTCIHVSPPCHLFLIWPSNSCVIVSGGKRVCNQRLSIIIKTCTCWLIAFNNGDSFFSHKNCMNGLASLSQELIRGDGVWWVGQFFSPCQVPFRKWSCRPLRSQQSSPCDALRFHRHR